LNRNTQCFFVCVILLRLLRLLRTFLTKSIALRALRALRLDGNRAWSFTYSAMTFVSFATNTVFSSCARGSNGRRRRRRLNRTTCVWSQQDLRFIPARSRRPRWSWQDLGRTWNDSRQEQQLAVDSQQNPRWRPPNRKYFYIRFAPGLHLDPAGELTTLPQTL